ncbi:metal ABC transporter ATP-binding protein [Sporichthya sp.]|uniref:metal ABC transporter ATP-binding protein n=1 Tax=Sporichthya sp. TaxID=65475 RepID=UPI0018592D29|nr:metal ABC transporter ATP-binding protein [Sporichthya sp.]MBA3745365.1 metal ABC transporter ATP-binding protein [Sporichthya sp.]
MNATDYHGHGHGETPSGTGESLITLTDVAFRYGPAPVLTDVELTVRRGNFTGVVGPSGSGKTTLLRLLLGTLRPVAGTIDRSPGLRVGYVPQLESVDWNFPVTVAECVLMSRSERRVPWPSRRERAELSAILERLGIGDLANRHIRALSGGQQQRMFIARALMCSPDLLLMDEPTTGVDFTSRHEMLHLLGDLNAAGTTILLTTHDLNGVAAHLPSLLALNHTVIAAGGPAEVITASVLERTFGAPMEVLQHLGLPVVLDPGPHLAPVRARRTG